MKKHSKMEEEVLVFDIPLYNKAGETVAWACCSQQHKEEIMKRSWHLDEGYARTSIKGGGGCTMHTMIMRDLEGHTIAPGNVIDHRDGNPLDNRLHMLRIVTVAQNATNKRKREGASSKYNGVGKRGESFSATVQFRNIYYTIGTFKVEEEAAAAYDAFVLTKPELAGACFRLNFPGRKELQLARPRKQKSSNYKGVSFIRRKKKFESSYQLNKKKVVVCKSEDAKECALAYDAAIVQQKLDRKLNFPENYPGYKPDLPIKLEILETGPNYVRVKIAQHPDAIVLIDNDDYERLKHTTCQMKGKGYITAVVAKKKWLLHRFVMNATDVTVLVDHINGDKHDNRKSNLRFSNALHNAQNRRKSAGGSSRYLGVSKIGSSFIATNKLGKQKQISKTLKKEIDAAVYRDLIIKKHEPASGAVFNFKWNDSSVKLWTDYFRAQPNTKNSKLFE